MLRYRNGDEQAFAVLYGRHKGPLYRYLLRQCRHPATAEELFQDIWLKLIRARQRYEPRARFATYLYSVAHNRLMDFYRQRRVPLPNPGGSHDPAELAAPATDGPEAGACLIQQVARLLQALAALPEAQREAFLLREEGGLSLDEIAEITGVDREAAKSRLRYAVAKLRQALGEAP